jgi:hypothetical protein
VTFVEALAGGEVVTVPDTAWVPLGIFLVMRPRSVPAGAEVAPSIWFPPESLMRMEAADATLPKATLSKGSNWLTDPAFVTFSGKVTPLPSDPPTISVPAVALPYCEPDGEFCEEAIAYRVKSGSSAKQSTVAAKVPEV